MNPIYFWVFLACAGLAPNIDIAQSSFTYSAARDAAYLNSNSENLVPDHLHMNDINVRASRYFLKNFPGVQHEQWAKTASGYNVLFNEGSVVTRLYFNTGGLFESSEKDYPGEEVYSDIQPLVHRRFPKYSIGIVRELYNGNTHLYEVTVSDKNTTKVFTVRNYEIEDLQEYDHG
jgi:hypothetical protein